MEAKDSVIVYLLREIHSPHSVLHRIVDRAVDKPVDSK